MADTQPPSETNGQNKSFASGGRASHATLIVLCLIFVSDYADRYVTSSMVNFIKADWGITDAQAGWLMGVVLLFITIFSLPASFLIDRWSRRKMVAIMTLLWSLATLACAFTRNYTQLLVARAFIGIGESGYAPAGTAMLAAAYSEEKRGLVMGIWNASIPLGVGIGMVAGGLIASHWHWSHAFGLVAFPGMILAAIAWFLPDYKSVKSEEATHSGGRGLIGLLIAIIKDIRQVVTIPTVLFTYLGFAMNVSVTTCVMHWLPSYFERVGLAEPGKGGLSTMPVFALVLVGAPLGGFLSDWWIKRRREARLWFPAITSGLAAVTLFLAFFLVGTGFQVPLFVLYGVFITCFIAPAIAVTQDVVHPGLRALAYALCVVAQHLFGDIWSAPLVGWLSDHLELGLAGAMLFVPLWGVMAALFFRIASLFYLKDLAKVEKVELEKE